MMTIEKIMQDTECMDFLHHLKPYGLEHGLLLKDPVPDNIKDMNRLGLVKLTYRGEETQVIQAGTEWKITITKDGIEFLRGHHNIAYRMNFEAETNNRLAREFVDDVMRRIVRYENETQGCTDKGFNRLKTALKEVL